MPRAKSPNPVASIAVFEPSTAILRALIQHSTDLVTLCDAAGRIVYMSPSVTRILGYEPEELLGRVSFDLLHPDDHARIAASFAAKTLSGAANAPVAMRLRHKDGGWRTLEATSTNLLHDPLVRGMVVNAHDITARIEAEQALGDNEERLRLLEAAVVNASDGVIVTEASEVDEPGPRIVYVNHALLRQTGYAEAEVIGRSPRMFQGPGTDPAALRTIRRALETRETACVEVLNYTKDGEELWIELSVAPVYSVSGEVTHFMAIQRNISAQKRVELQRSELSAALAHQARYDGLTGLPNRYFFNDRIQQAIAAVALTNSELALLFIDLDNFKHLNDTLGHPVGDALLTQIVARLMALVPPEVMLARWGGDEFIVVVPDIGGRDQAVAIAKQLLGALETPFILHERELFITASIGISCFPHDGDDPTTLLRHADSAMYRAKASGRNTVQCFVPEMSATALQRLDLEHALRRALARHEFVLHYQPIVDANTREVRVLEALLRWQHPERGLVPPAEFIRLVEENGMIVPIGAWVLEECCRQAVAWRNAGLTPVRIAVNVSALQFERDDFVDQVATLLERYDISPEWLELEVTEGVVMQDIEKVVRRLAALRARGLCVAIDDFGSGYSSLSYLRRLPVDILKIDRSFVWDVGAAAHGERDPIALIEAIVTLAHALKLLVVAEGVETEQQYTLLRQIGCDHIQGYLFARPMPAARVLELPRGSGGVLMV